MRNKINDILTQNGAVLSNLEPGDVLFIDEIHEIYGAGVQLYCGKIQ